MLCDTKKNTDSSRMELQAAIAGMAILDEPCRVEVVSDSKNTVDAINGQLDTWKQNGWRSSKKRPIVHQDLWQQLDAQMQVHEVSATWVKGHSGHKQNSICDRIARSLSK
jgi:ribonuclease HI